MRAAAIALSILVLAATAQLSGCTDAFDPEASFYHCTSDDQCLDGWSCDVANQRCVPGSGPDLDEPDVDDAQDVPAPEPDVAPEVDDTGGDDPADAGPEEDVPPPDCDALTPPGPCLQYVLGSGETECVLAPAPIGTACDDADPCTSPDACDSKGQCTGPWIDCEDGNPCTADVCAAGSGCVSFDITAPCSDGNPCTKNDLCVAGECVPEFNACACDLANDTCEVDFGNDDLCDGTLVCVDSVCEVDPDQAAVTCAAPNDPCEVAACAPASGACVTSPADDGAGCDDADPCTTGTTCEAGVCGSGAGVCDDDDPCTTDLCDATGDTFSCGHEPTCECTVDSDCEAPASPCRSRVCVQGACVTVAADDGPTECDDDLCTTGDACSSGVCIAGSPLECDDGTACTGDACDPTTGACEHPPLADGTLCAEGGLCVSSACEPAPDGMTWVPGGPFSMGCDVCDDDEAPQHTVTLTAFAFDLTEVTASAYGACVDAGECAAAGDGEGCVAADGSTPNHPVNCVTFAQAEAYCAWRGARLPTEAEWEKAARGGCELYPGDCAAASPPYPWGFDAPTCSLATMLEDSPGCGSGGPDAVGARPDGASPYGAHDLAGNVAEWVADWYDATYYATSPDTDPPGPADGGDGNAKVFRGGSYNGGPYAIRTTRRGKVFFEVPDVGIGFRCARDVTE